MQQALPWILVSLSIGLLVGFGLVAWLRRRPRAAALPTDWALAARPVFSPNERRLYRHLREALPHHVVLAKLPLVRFCQPTDPEQVRFWYGLLGAIHVTYAICSANGRVLAAIDLDTERHSGRRVQQIKQAVLGACRVRYLRCPIDHLPSIPELHLLVPQGSVPAGRPHQPASATPQSRSPQPAGAAPSPPKRTSLWQDSRIFDDSFFTADRDSDGAGVVADRPGRPPSGGETGGIVDDGPAVRH